MKMQTLAFILAGMAFAGPVSAGSVNMRSINGEAVVEMNGREVWRGASGPHLQVKSSSIDGNDYAALLDGDKVLWESEPGAAERVKVNPLAGTKPSQGGEAGGKAQGKSSKSETGISTSTKDGMTTVTMGGKQVWKGKTTGKVSTNSVTVDGKNHAAAFEGDKVLWESSKGAAEIVRKLSAPPVEPPKK
jgi:hypothetical protein